jgi:hypothetical protein
MFIQKSKKKSFINQPFPKNLKDAVVIRDIDFNPVIEDIKNLGDEVNTLSTILPTPGPVGPIGPQGVPGPVGPAGLNWQGVWDGTNVSYVVDDAVGFGGASWFCINNIASNPSNLNPSVDTTNWALLAAQGSTGPQGPQGIPGASPIFYVKTTDGATMSGGGGTFDAVSDVVVIPANTLTADSIIEVTFGIVRLSGSTVQPRLFLNTSNSLIGATQIAAGLNISTNNQISAPSRKLYLDYAGQIIKSNPDGLTTINLPSSVTNFLSVPFDPTVDNYLLFGAHHPVSPTTSKLVYSNITII